MNNAWPHASCNRCGEEEQERGEGGQQDIRQNKWTVTSTDLKDSAVRGKIQLSPWSLASSKTQRTKAILILLTGTEETLQMLPKLLPTGESGYIAAKALEPDLGLGTLRRTDHYDYNIRTCL